MAAGHEIVHLPFEPPYDWPAITAFLHARATPGVEIVEPGRYCRTIAIAGGSGEIDVRYDPARPRLELRLRILDRAARPSIVARVRQMFDLDAEPAVIGRHLSRDPRLAALWRSHPGIRTPGAWDAFELAVRAILGQQVSVRAATTLAGRLAEAHGTPVALDGGLSRLFPHAAQLIDAPLERLGIMPARAAAIRALAHAVSAGELTLQESADGAARVEMLRRLPGIGPWTAGYIAMRAYRDADALPSGDLVLRQVTGAANARELEQLTQPWRPWRSYAVMLLWQSQASKTARPTRPGRATARR